ncbi:MAG: hypothetical protein GY725_20745 [bacterium]|nr:hypothetical protein [bacterium]
MCLDEESPELLLEDALSDSISRKDGGFLPGLRPRDHGEVLGAVFAGGLDEQEAERLLHDLMSRRQPAPAESEEPPEADESSFGDRASAASGQEAVDPGPGDLETPAPPPTPESRRNVRRLEAARREVGAFEPRNAYQAELRTVLFAIMDHMSRLALSGRTSRKHCEPGEEADCERWWAVLEV